MQGGPVPTSVELEACAYHQRLPSALRLDGRVPSALRLDRAKHGRVLGPSPQPWPSARLDGRVLGPD